MSIYLPYNICSVGSIYAQGFLKMWTYVFEIRQSILLKNRLHRAKLGFMFHTKSNLVIGFLPRWIVSKNVNELSSKSDNFFNYILMTLCCFSFNRIWRCCYCKYRVIASSLLAQLFYLHQFNISKSAAWMLSIRCDISCICFLKSRY